MDEASENKGGRVCPDGVLVISFGDDNFRFYRSIGYSGCATAL